MMKSDKASLAEFTAKLLRLTDRLHQETLEFEDYDGPYEETVSAWVDAVVDVERYLGWHVDEDSE